MFSWYVRRKEEGVLVQVLGRSPVSPSAAPQPPLGSRLPLAWSLRKEGTSSSSPRQNQSKCAAAVRWRRSHEGHWSDFKNLAAITSGRTQSGCRDRSGRLVEGPPGEKISKDVKPLRGGPQEGGRATRTGQVPASASNPAAPLPRASRKALPAPGGPRLDRAQVADPKERGASSSEPHEEPGGGPYGGQGPGEVPG